MRRILLLDMDQPLADTVKRKLEQEGFIVTVGSIPDLASKFDLVILGDLSFQPKGTPWIRLSNNDKVDDLWQLKMPFRPSDLLDLTHQRLDSGR